MINLLVDIVLRCIALASVTALFLVSFPLLSLPPLLNSFLFFGPFTVRVGRNYVDTKRTTISCYDKLSNSETEI